MFIKMRTVSAGPDGNRFPDVIYQVHDEEGADLVKGGYAVFVEPEKKAEAKKEESEDTVERADVVPTEKQEAPEGRHTGRRRR